MQKGFGITPRGGENMEGCGGAYLGYNRGVLKVGMTGRASSPSTAVLGEGARSCVDGCSPSIHSELDLGQWHKEQFRGSGGHGDLETQHLDTIFITWLGLEWSMLSGTHILEKVCPDI